MTVIPRFDLSAFHRAIITMHRHNYCLIKVFLISLPEAEVQVIKLEHCCDIWLNFALVTVQSPAVRVEMYRGSDISLSHNANFHVSIPLLAVAACKI